MPNFDPNKPSPSQVFAQEGAEFASLLEEKETKLPDKIDRYQVIEELGRGGMGCVYKAYDPQMKTFLALKVIIKKSCDPKGVEVQRFIREAKAMARMNHPNIVRVYDTGEDNNSPFITMDYIEGISLKEYLERTPLDVRLFSQLIIKIGKAIQYAHDRGIIHRDLKPVNIMLDKALEPQVMDFGLAKLVESDKSLSKTGAIIGTPQYMSPEQVQGKKVNHLSDIYSLGAIFYEMLCGKPLIPGQTMAQIMFKLINKEPKLLRQVNNKLSTDLETICHKAIEKEMDKRYQKVNDFVSDINKFLVGELISARPYSFLEKSWRKLKQNRLAVVVAITGISLTIVGILIFQMQQNQKAHSHLAIAKKWQQQANNLAGIDKQMEIYIHISNLLEKALSLSNSSAIKNELIETLKRAGLLAKEQKNYLLSFSIFQQCKKLGYKQANKLLNQLEQEKNQLEEKHRKLIAQIMDRITYNTHEALVDRYVFTIVKMQKPYVVKILLSFLEAGNKSQKSLAVKALGMFGNTYTKSKGKDSVQWLLKRLENFKDSQIIQSNQQEIEEIIWALGWLKDKRANFAVYSLRWLAGKESLLWNKTKIPHKWIPIENNFLIKNRKFATRGDMKQEKGDYLGAIADYNKSLALNPNNFRAYNNRGNVYRDYLKKYKKAIADYNKTIALDPKSFFAYNNRGNAYQNLKEYKKAIIDYNKAILLNPKISHLYINRGATYAKLEEYNKAIVDYNKAIALDPNKSLVYYNRASVYQALKEYTKAIADYNKAITFLPKYSYLYNNRGNVYQTLKKYTKAIADYSKAIFLNPKNSQAYHNRGNAFKTLKDYSKAIADYSKAILLDPKFSKAYNNRGLIYVRLEDYSKAIADYSKAILLDPKFSKLYNNRGTAYLRLKNYPKAIADYSKAIFFHSKNSQAYNNRGTAYLRLKNYPKAIADYNKAIIFNPKFSQTYNSRGIAYLRLKDYSKAIADFSKTITFDPKNSSAYLNRGAIYMDLRQYPKAYHDFQIFLKLAPKHPQWPNVKATVYKLKRMFFFK